MARAIRFLFVLSFLSAKLWSTDKALLDSMQQVLQSTRDTVTKLNCLYTLSFEYGLIDPRRGIDYGKQCLDLATKANNLFYQYNAYNGMANGYETMANFDSSRYCNFKSYEIGRQMRKKNLMAIALCNIGISYKEQGDYRKALEMQLAGYKLLENEKAYNPRIHVYIADMYSRVGNYPQAEYHARLGINKVKEFVHDPHVILNLNIMLAKCQMNTNRIDSAINLLTQTLAGLKKNTDQLSLCLGLNALGEAYMKQNDPKKAFGFFSEEYTLQHKLKNENGICLASLNMASALAQGGKKNAATVRNYLLESEKRLLAIQKNKDILRNTYFTMAATYEQVGDAGKALQFHKLYSALSDTLLNKEKFQQLNELQTRYETEKKEKLIQLQRAEIETQKTFLENKKFQLIAVIAVFGIIISFGLLFYYRYEARQKLLFVMEVQRLEKLRESAVEEKEMEERNRISKDIHDELGSGLSKIALIAEYSKQHLNGNKVLAENIQVISKTASALTDNMRELVWALNSSGNTLDHLAARMYEYGSEYLEDLSLKSQFNFPDEIPPIKIPKSVQRNIFLTFKEAMNNSVKHAEANSFYTELRIADHELELTFSDNGKGFENNFIRKTGNGLHNMRQRIEHIGGRLSVNSSSSGTSVNICVPLKDNSIS